MSLRRHHHHHPDQVVKQAHFINIFVYIVLYTVHCDIVVFPQAGHMRQLLRQPVTVLGPKNCHQSHCRLIFVENKILHRVANFVSYLSMLRCRNKLLQAQLGCLNVSFIAVGYFC